jgi:hypothetical protein
VVVVFAVVYLGMFLGGLPTLKLDRTGVALLGAIAVIPLTGQSVEQSARRSTCPPSCCCLPSWWCRRRCAWAASTPR